MADDNREIESKAQSEEPGGPDQEAQPSDDEEFEDETDADEDDAEDLDEEADDQEQTEI